MEKVLFLFLLLAGVALLQIFLSKQENRWLGLILPIISLMFSLLFVLNMAVLPNQTTSQTIMETGFTFVLLNIPTMILMAIYLACWEKFKKSREIDKMNIHDLE